MTGAGLGFGTSRRGSTFEPAHGVRGRKTKNGNSLPAAVAALDQRDGTLPQVFRIAIGYAIRRVVMRGRPKLICAPSGFPVANPIHINRKAEIAAPGRTTELARRATSGHRVPEPEATGSPPLLTSQQAD